VEASSQTSLDQVLVFLSSHLVDEYEAQGSRIAVTTRSVGIASVKPTVPTRRLRELTEGDAWLVFAKYAFDGGSSISRPDMEGIGTDVV
jgi:hypothetical protein